ncbi:PREDICTED: uncharacterized protein LOC108556560 [Nicrophorus vespilloides]|uniref:Uncharacterized protein LOC108556560 n=1 Tax=Nicrophorus vespilloides TaxID=110193 RepID=A0ABM1M0W9_NICVS|nr:PREDICTED: uncharacterized protein LOC108556560 [Nicrophorus vespilloides]
MYKKTVETVQLDSNDFAFKGQKIQGSTDMFKCAFILISLAMLHANCLEYTLEECKCGEGYKAEKNEGGKVECLGVMVAHAKPCNLPEVPKCVCSEEVSAILTDAEGSWCTNGKGDSKKKWACENKADWDEYKLKYDEYEKTLKL